MVEHLFVVFLIQGGPSQFNIFLNVRHSLDVIAVTIVPAAADVFLRISLSGTHHNSRVGVLQFFLSKQFNVTLHFLDLVEETLWLYESCQLVGYATDSSISSEAKHLDDIFVEELVHEEVGVDHKPEILLSSLSFVLDLVFKLLIVKVSLRSENFFDSNVCSRI